MKQEAKKAKKNIDYWILLCVIGLTIIGVVSIFSATMYTSGLSGNPFSYFIKQLIFAIVGISLMLFISKIDLKAIKKMAPLIMLGAIVLLIIVLFVGTGDDVGARRWISIPGGTIQPSEFAKIALILFMSYYIEKHNSLIGSFKYGVLPHLILAIVVCGLIAVEPNLSTATIIGALIVGMLIIGGINLRYFIPFAVLGGGGIFYMIVAHPWRMERMLTFLDPWKDIKDSGWQVCQSLMALGSGGLFGTGFGDGKAKLLFMPEPQNDFIFAHIGEEMGLLFGIFLISVYLFLIWRCIIVALEAPDTFSMLFAGGMAGLLGMQVFINIGVVTASIPVTGMPLPFISAGASSLISLMCGMGVVLNISRYTGSHSWIKTLDEGDDEKVYSPVKKRKTSVIKTKNKKNKTTIRSKQSKNIKT